MGIKKLDEVDTSVDRALLDQGFLADRTERWVLMEEPTARGVFLRLSPGVVFRTRDPLEADSFGSKEVAIASATQVIADTGGEVTCRAAKVIVQVQLVSEDEHLRVEPAQGRALRAREPPGQDDPASGVDRVEPGLGASR